MNSSKTFRNKILYIAAFITSCFFVWGCENDEVVIRELSENKVMVEEAKNIESFLSQDGRMKARLLAPLMLRVMADTVYFEFPKSLHVDFFDDSARVESKLDCKYGKYFENLNKVYLRDSVIVITSKGDTLKSPDLWWDQNLKIFYTDKYAIYHGVNKSIFGTKGLRATQDLTSIIFHEPIGTVTGSENDFLNQ